MAYDVGCVNIPILQMGTPRVRVVKPLAQVNKWQSTPCLKQTGLDLICSVSWGLATRCVCPVAPKVLLGDSKALGNII